jgi:hypothetical protein
MIQRIPLLVVPAPHIIRGGRTREVELGSKVAIEGYVTVELIEAHSGRVKFKSQYKNVITDAAINAWFANDFISSMRTWCAVGTGSTAPAAGQTSLVSEYNTPVTRTNSNGGVGDAEAFVVSGTTGYNYHRRTRVFTETQVNGNLTEFGFFSASSGGTMFARQLFKDSMGNPVVITKTALDQLRITHEIRLWEMDADETYTVTIGGVVYDTTERIGGSQTTMWRPHDGFNTFGTPSCQLTTLQTLSARTSYQAGTGPTTTTKQAYTNGNFYRDVIHTWDPPTANFTTAPAGVGYCRHGVDSTAYQFQNNFTPKIPKDNTKRLTLNIRYTMARP